MKLDKYCDWHVVYWGEVEFFSVLLVDSELAAIVTCPHIYRVHCTRSA